MTNEEINRRCAEFLGWLYVPENEYTSAYYKNGDDYISVYVWNPCENISDAWLLMSKVPQEKRSTFVIALEEIVKKEQGGDVISISVINLWFNVTSMAICKAVLKLEG